MIDIVNEQMIPLSKIPAWCEKQLGDALAHAKTKGAQIAMTPNPKANRFIGRSKSQ